MKYDRAKHGPPTGWEWMNQYDEEDRVVFVADGSTISGILSIGAVYVWVFQSMTDGKPTHIPKWEVTKIV